MDKPDKSLLGMFGARGLAPKAAGERSQLSLKNAGGERPDLKQYFKERSREIASFKRSDGAGREAALRKADYFLEQEEETMRALWRKRRR